MVLAAVALALVVVPIPDGSTPLSGHQIAVAVERDGKVRNRNDEASIGDTLVVRAVVEDNGSELRVYDDSGVALASCAAPGPNCRVEAVDGRTTLVLEIKVLRPDELLPIRFSPPLGTRSAGREADVSAATKAGIVVTRHEPVRFH
jgi:hypothetical protein